LELGVDVGELSTVLLCSVPPTTANYLQRVGRSGRRDGNALNVAIANGRPHDLYFFADPQEILAGVIEPPGVFLNASAILERQFTAYCFDRWVASGVGEDVFSVRLGEVLTNVEGNRLAAFPHTWLDFIDNNRTEFFASFVGLFAGELDAETVDQLRRFVEGEVEREGSLRWRILSGLEALVNERESLRKRVRALGTRIRRLRQTAVRPQNWEEELEALQREREGLQELVASIDGKETLNFFTDEGWIPNYAFPEAGVTLRSIIWRRRREEEEGGRRYETWSYEYTRAALIRRMIPEERSNDLFIVGDAHQRIYRRSVVLGRCGVNIRGRSRKLRINYRTTDETRRWAAAVVAGVPVDDLDEGIDDLKGYRSLIHGEPPEVRRFPSFAEEVAWVANWAKGLGAEMSEACLVTRTQAVLERFAEALNAAEVATYRVRRNEAEDRVAPGLRLATMHRVKGLTFGRIAIADANRGILPLEASLAEAADPASRREAEHRERRLLFVAATRARREVKVLVSSDPSPLLPAVVGP